MQAINFEIYQKGLKHDLFERKIREKILDVIEKVEF